MNLHDKGFARHPTSFQRCLIYFISSPFLIRSRCASLEICPSSLTTSANDVRVYVACASHLNWKTLRDSDCALIVISNRAIVRKGNRSASNLHPSRLFHLLAGGSGGDMKVYVVRRRGELSFSKWRRDVTAETSVEEQKREARKKKKSPLRLLFLSLCYLPWFPAYRWSNLW